MSNAEGVRHEKTNVFESDMVGLTKGVIGAL
jgi:hypothetical protein